jgi:phospholipid transport system substrate-binding protein
MRTVQVLLAALALLVSTGAAADPQPAVAADVLVKRVSDELVESLQRIQSDPKRVSALVEEKLLPHFDSRRATRIALGSAWRHASAEQQERLVREFTTLLVRTYSGALASYRNHRIDFSPLRARPGDDEVTVRSVVRQPGAEPIAIEYDLERAGASWKVFDVRVAGISLVATYRTSFAEHVRNHGIDGLISMLERRNSGSPRELRM